MDKEDVPQNVYLHLIGKTGTGKSATGNSILGDKVFKESSSTTSTVDDILIKKIDLDGRTVSVVDGPGLIGVDATGFNQDHWDKYKKVCEDNADCGHVFLIVCRYGERFTAEDSSMVDALLKDLGRDVFRNHGIVVVTCGDNFEADFEDEEGTTFVSWCRGQGGGFGQLVAACDQRVLLVENSARSADRGDLLQKLKYILPSIKYGYEKLQFVTEDSYVWNTVSMAVANLSDLWHWAASCFHTFEPSGEETTSKVTKDVMSTSDSFDKVSFSDVDSYIDPEC